MKSLLIDETETTPRVCLDSNKNEFWICGESRPENAKEFYAETMKWFDEYKVVLNQNLSQGQSRPNIEINLDFSYLNSISIKYIYDMLKKIEGFEPLANIIINWHVIDGDIEMEQNGEEYAKLIKLPFNTIVKS